MKLAILSSCLMTLLLLPVASRADSSPTVQSSSSDIIHVGFGPSLDGTTNPKEFAIGHEKVIGEFGLLSHCGLLFEGELNGYCAIVPGVHIETLSGIFVRAGVGPAYVLHTSDRISSHWNANIDFMLGFYQGWGLIYAEGGHLSNAGFVPPNLGDDHLLIGIGVRI
jgi:hypothetical protein